MSSRLAFAVARRILVDRDPAALASVTNQQVANWQESCGGRRKRLSMRPDGRCCGTHATNLRFAGCAWLAKGPQVMKVRKGHAAFHGVWTTRSPSRSFAAPDSTSFLQNCSAGTVTRAAGMSGKRFILNPPRSIARSTSGNKPWHRHGARHSPRLPLGWYHRSAFRGDPFDRGKASRARIRSRCVHRSGRGSRARGTAARGPSVLLAPVIR